MAEGLKFLQKIRENIPALRSIDAEVKERYMALFNVAAPPLDSEKVSGGASAGLDRKLEAIEDYHEKILNEKIEMERQIRLGYKLLHKLDNMNYYRVLWDFYFRGLDEETIAKTMYPAVEGEKVRRPRVSKLKREAVEAFEKVYEVEICE